jgi:hypothetical protein
MNRKLTLFDLQTAARFISEIGLPIRAGVVFDSAEVFLPGYVDLDCGGIVYDLDQITDMIKRDSKFSSEIPKIIGNMLHEAGHLAILPRDLRPLMTGDVEDSFPTNLLPKSYPLPRANYREAAAAAWAAYAALHLDLPLSVAFDEIFESRRAGEMARRSFMLGNHVGITLLQEIGIKPKESWLFPVAPLPKMKLKM